MPFRYSPLLGLAGLLAACGSNPEPAPQPTPTATEPAEPECEAATLSISAMNGNIIYSEDDARINIFKGRDMEISEGARAHFGLANELTKPQYAGPAYNAWKAREGEINKVVEGSYDVQRAFVEKRYGERCPT